MPRGRPAPRSPRAAPGRSKADDDDVAWQIDDDERQRIVEALLGHRFHDVDLLFRALTHSSVLNEPRRDGPALKAPDRDNELLEFLGDSVLSLAVVDTLVHGSPDAGEGELTERRAAHVSADSLAKAAITHGLDRLVRVGGGVRVDGAVPANVAADVVEAILGALWLDCRAHEPASAFAICQRAVERLLGPPPERAPIAEVHAKRRLQERLQRLFGKAPDYDVRRADGPSHAPRFVADVRFRQVLLGTGEGGNKRVATEEAARAACELLDSLDDVAVRERLG